MVRQAHHERVCFLQGYKKKENALKFVMQAVQKYPDAWRAQL
jgi:hypothetical protein